MTWKEKLGVSLVFLLVYSIFKVEIKTDSFSAFGSLNSHIPTAFSPHFHCATDIKCGSIAFLLLSLKLLCPRCYDKCYKTEITKSLKVTNTTNSSQTPSARHLLKTLPTPPPNPNHLPHKPTPNNIPTPPQTRTSTLRLPSLKNQALTAGVVVIVFLLKEL